MNGARFSRVSCAGRAITAVIMHHELCESTEIKRFTMSRLRIYFDSIRALNSLLETLSCRPCRDRGPDFRRTTPVARGMSLRNGSVSPTGIFFPLAHCAEKKPVPRARWGGRKGDGLHPVRPGTRHLGRVSSSAEPRRGLRWQAAKPSPPVRSSCGVAACRAGAAPPARRRESHPDGDPCAPRSSPPPWRSRRSGRPPRAGGLGRHA